MPDATPSEEKPKPAASSGTLGVLRVFGVPVRFHFTFVLLLIFLLVIGVGERQSGAMTALYVLALFGSVLLHELGHTLVARQYGIRTTEIVMYPIGGVSRPERIPKGREEFWIAISGPLVNGLIAAALFAWLATQHQHRRLAIVFSRLWESDLSYRLSLSVSDTSVAPIASSRRWPLCPRARKVAAVIWSA